MLVAWIFVLVPLTIYLAAFAVETYASFARLSRRGAGGRDYLDATWEITHTFLVVAIAFFASLFSQNMVEIAEAAFNGLFLAAAFIGIRSVLYVHLFHIRSAGSLRRNWLDHAFAWSHVGIAGGIIVLLIELLPALARIDLSVNDHLIPWMWPGLFLTIALCSIPIFLLYHTRR